MKDCWKHNPEDRPDFQESKMRIQDVINNISLNAAMSLLTPSAHSSLSCANMSDCNSKDTSKSQYENVNDGIEMDLKKQKLVNVNGYWCSTEKTSHKND